MKSLKFQVDGAIPSPQIITKSRMTKERQQFLQQIISASHMTSVNKESVIEMIPKIR